MINYKYTSSDQYMFNEEKVKKDLERMREIYANARKKIGEIKKRQDEIQAMVENLKKKVNISVSPNG